MSNPTGAHDPSVTDYRATALARREERVGGD